jgi:hypothetical protein
VRIFKGRSKVADVLREFFGCPTHELPIVSRGFSAVDLPNLQVAIEGYAQKLGAERQVVGYTGSMRGMQETLSDLIGKDGWLDSTRIGPVEYKTISIDVDREMECVDTGIHLIASKGERIAANVHRERYQGGDLALEVMALDKEAATAFLNEVRDRVYTSNVYRGKILSLGASQDPRQMVLGCEGLTVSFHRFPSLTQEQIILPEATLTLLDRNTLGFLRHADALRRSGRSVKRGLLFHGKPGTGKTLTAKWLAQTMPGVTVILLAAEQLGLIKICCQMARMLAPSLVVMEDVDLVATQRDERRDPIYQIRLHQLLNEMDGLTSEAEVIFVLTTNRPDVLEPALAARPGRIDQAIEFPLPDEECRRRLLELYGRGLTLDLADPDRLIAKTDGASPAFIQELVRKAALFAAEDDSVADGTLRLTDVHFDEALKELLLGGGELTRNLLGFTAETG